MIDDALNLNEERLQAVIAEVAEVRDPFSTIDVIRGYTSTYNTNRDIPVDASLNAEFGRFLARNSACLGIRKVAGDVIEADDCGNRTTTAMWSIG